MLSEMPLFGGTVSGSRPSKMTVCSTASLFYQKTSSPAGTFAGSGEGVPPVIVTLTGAACAVGTPAASAAMATMRRIRARRTRRFNHLASARQEHHARIGASTNGVGQRRACPVDLARPAFAPQLVHQFDHLT